MPKTVETTVTYLRMDTPPHIRVLPPDNLRLSLMHLDHPPVHYYRYLYNTIGDAYDWIDRRVMSDDQLAKAIHADGVDIYVVYSGGVPAGYFELAREGDETWLAYFGIMPEFIGRGLGKWLLYEAVTTGWATNPKAMCVETCTLDHPRALGLYQQAGFRPYARKEKTMEIPDGI